MNTIPKRQPYRNQKIRDAAAGEECALNLTGVCNYDKSTTVFAHLNKQWAGKGVGQKADDCAGVFACSACHAAYDEHPWMVDNSDLLRAYYRTIRRLINKGVLK